MIPASALVDEVRFLNGSLVLLLDRSGTFLRLVLPTKAKWLRAEIERRKPDIITELRQRYLQGAR